MDLFDFEHDPADIKMGFRLIRLEVYNWGTFDGEIWSMELDGETSLLTGDVGSGKSTLVDALITLLVPPKKVTYNKAADASARERSLNSYIRGYYAQKRSEDGIGQPEALRDRNQYSVVLAVFGDENIGARVTLAQVFWYKDETGSPQRFYVLGEKTLSIENHFSNFGNDIRFLRKRLSNDTYIHIYDDYPRYSEEFRRRFGIGNHHAMDLFQQTISMKKVDALTSFVRQNMLEQPGTQNDVQRLLEHFHDLDTAHSAVVRARKQEEQLVPLTETGESYFDLHGRQVVLEEMETALNVWFASKDKALREKTLLDLKANLAEVKAEHRAVMDDKQQNEESIENVQRQLYQNGGDKVSVIEEKIANAGKELDARNKQRQQYAEAANELQLAVPDNQAAFDKNNTSLSELNEFEKNHEAELAEARSENDSELKALQNSISMLQRELESLRSRKSSISAEYIELRKQICQDLDLAEGELPFAGELMQVMEGEEEWEGAIERLLHGFGMSLLVPKFHYGEIIQWMEQHSVKRRIVYYCCEEYVEPTNFSDLPEAAACTKLEIRQDSPFTNWVMRELAQRFSHVCCENQREFQQEKYAITRKGQIKTQGKRHEKDDRFGLDDRRRYVLGFSNLKKIQALELEVENLEEAVREANKMDGRLKRQISQSRKKQLAVNSLLHYQDFSLIDSISMENSLEEYKRKLKELQEENILYTKLEKELGELKTLRKDLDLRLQRIVVALNNINYNIKVHSQGIKADEDQLADIPEEIKAAVLPRISERAAQVFGDTPITLDNQVKSREILRENIRHEREILVRAKEEKGQQLVVMMQRFKASFPELGDELIASSDSLNDYRQLLSRLQMDSLPRFEEKFRILLRENTINRMALFQEKLNTECDEIRERIEMINKSLATIDYSEGRYIQIECDNVADNDIKDFRRQLKHCISGFSDEAGEGVYSEEQFRQIEGIIQRFRGRPECAEIDKRWTGRVTDVRNWFSFAASERWRDTDEEYEHYTDSGGKSGGQKEKLAYTILAASLVYNFGLEAKHKAINTFRFVVIDEAFLKSSDESARFGLELFRKLDLQLLVVTPLLKIGTIEPYVSHVGFVYQDDQKHRSYLRNLTIKQLEKERQKFRE
ncbi:MAG: hypothetical protein K6C05_06100 [Anaerovibrio sp.]|uniref:ATP-binding protein n=1 Tax=Anaerovibrio sp. TaxID=1872532 RepID=UPI0025F2C957|nr:ATP-binding protein [Anaerovibrio sp.]MCR5176408.1 hypothetical protein [Anaerovibrio sp.]